MAAYKKINRHWLGIIFSLFLAQPIFAQLRLPRLISNGMVLQRNKPLTIWGWATPGETITVQLNNAVATTQTDATSQWRINLPAQKPGGPYTIHIKGHRQITLTDIWIGDVWLCSGQSNMELTMDRVKYKYPEEMKAEGNLPIRQFLVPDKYNFNSPQQDVDDGSWLPVNQQNIGQFSAVAYFFAKEIYAHQKIPIGLIKAALGGSPAEAWISEEALQPFPQYLTEAQKLKSQAYIDSIEDADRKRSADWYKTVNANDEGLRNNWHNSNGYSANWQPITLPGYWADTYAGAFNGVVWFSKTIDVPTSFIGKSVKLELGRIVDADSVFVNGRFAGTTSYQYPPRRYILPVNLLQPGANTITIRVVNNSGRGGFVLDKRYELTTDSDTINLAGAWQYKIGAVMPPLPGQTFVRWKPLGLYNAMIAPLTPFAIKGILWYQGEANAGRPADYQQLMQTLIANWRTKWQEPNLPFLYVQLANYMETKESPQSSSWAALRQQQLNTLSVPNTGMAVAIDIGDWNDIHPENKKAVGYRLSLLARKLVYGEKKLVASGPLYQSNKIKGNTIVISFSNTGSGLTTSDGKPLQQFAIAGVDKKFVWAKAIIQKNKVVVWHESIKEPVAVRYAWADNPDGANLCNKEKLPASPFTTEKE